MENKQYLTILNSSPIPCILFSIADEEHRQSNTIEVLEMNKRFIEKTNNNDNNRIVDLDSKVVFDLRNLKNNDEGIKVLNFNENLGGLYEVDIYRVEENKYILWYTRQVDTNNLSHDENEYGLSDYKILNLISDTTPDSIFVKDNRGIFIHCNKVFAKNRNLTKEEVIGKTEEEIYTSNEKIERYKKEEIEIMENKEPIITVNSFVDEEGITKYFETVKVPLLDKDNMFKGVLAIARDITHRKEYEYEFERLRMQFFSNLSHEFKTPLNIIFSSIQLIESMIERNKDDRRYITYTKLIKQNGYRLLKMVNNLIDNTRLNAGSLEYSPQNYNIVEFVENICDSVRYYASEQNIDLVFDTNKEEQVIAFDLEKMDRIMLNLLSNAIKYNKEEGRIRVTLNFDDTDLYIKVSDNGIGIDKEKLEDVFKVFKKVHDSNVRAIESSGIGLSIVKSLVDLHNGSIYVKSEKNVGSEFTVKIPISVCDSTELDKKTFTYNRYVDNIDIEFSDIYECAK